MPVHSLKNRTIKDNLSILRVYWDWLVDRGYASENCPIPFTNVTLPAEKRKAAAEKVRLPFTASDIRKLHQAIEAGRCEMMLATFKLAIYTGCRIEELTALEAANVTEDVIKIDRVKTPSGRPIISRAKTPLSLHRFQRL